MYEYCLEYGSFPLTLADDFYHDPQEVPDFLADDAPLVARLTQMNDLFHELFITIECRFDYVGRQFPEKIALIRDLYDQLAQEIKEKYGTEQTIRFEPFIL